MCVPATLDASLTCVTLKCSWTALICLGCFKEKLPDDNFSSANLVLHPGGARCVQTIWQQRVYHNIQYSDYEYHWV